MAYNGWTNYETWAVGLWLDNDEGLCNHVIPEMSQDCWDDSETRDQVKQGIWTREQSARFSLADALKEFVADNLIPDLGASLAADLLGAAMSEVDWDELADHYLDEVDKTEEVEEV